MFECIFFLPIDPTSKLVIHGELTTWATGTEGQ